MINFAKFEIIGRIGEIDAKPKVTNVSVCANYRRRGEGDQWTEDSYWNRVVIFSDGQRKYIEEKAQVGDLVRVSGRLRDSSYERDGTTHYTTDRIVEEFGVLASKAA
ncbi:single-stranded DNA-binding protein [Sphingomonas sp. SRS2]|jgi:single-strand DNA-binding protein|uniref:single-stranded DNA-binding protein n=1 Tax=Sphingomonas sp. SRS2 TaxID=133190 RepID=UPI00061845FD|nr:single-stranded DNA-binding protein [Sphingomonas sp. SRS2]KKC25003.1 single-stranded DNA-binding protein [Sphingomonas sp. SRS2]